MLQRIAEMLAAGLTTRDIAEVFAVDERAILALVRGNRPRQFTQAARSRSDPCPS
ncbi:MAG: hypothetical protein WD795_18105 [Woeseia sp.]